MTTIGIIGAGRVGNAVARIALAAGYDVRIAGSGSPAHIEAMTNIVARGAQPAWATDAVRAADLVVLALPLDRLETLDPELYAGKIVIDAMNEWIDGPDPRTVEERLAAASTSEFVAEHLSGAHIAKTLNHVGYSSLDLEAREPNDPLRKGLVVVSNSPDSLDAASEFIYNIGFDPVKEVGLARGRWLEPGTDLFGDPRTAAELRDLLDRSFEDVYTGASAVPANPFGL